MAVRHILLALALPTVGLLPFAALAAGEGKGGSGKGGAASSASASAAATTSGGKRYDPDNITGISKHMETLVEGNKKYLARDFTGAIATYRSAIELNPKHALGHYLLGEAQLAAGNLQEAEASWKQAELNSDSRDPTLRARVLFVLADLKERTKKWDEAKAAWASYADWAQKFADAGVFPGSAASRQSVIDAMQKQDRAYADVRQRIRDTADGGVFTDPNKQPPPKQ